FSGWSVASWLGDAIDLTHLLANVLILGAQVVAIAGFLITKRMLAALLIVFDAMHVAIAVASGANFWPWILLNVAITIVVLSRGYQLPNRFIGLASVVFILISPRVADVA